MPILQKFKDKHSRWSGGLTLVELLVTLSLLSIVLCCSLPLAPSLYKKNQMQMIVDNVKGAIQVAKMQALISGDTLALTPIGGAGDWSDGMLLFVDNVKHQYSSETRLLYQWHWKSVGVDLAWQGFQSRNYLLFAPDMSSNATNGYFIITNHQLQAKLVVNRFGRVKVDVQPI